LLDGLFVCFVCVDDLASECGLTDIAPSRNIVPTPVAAYVPPDTDPPMGSCSVYADANVHSLPPTGRSVASRRSHDAASTASFVTMPSAASARMPASAAEVGTLPKLELKERTLIATIIEVMHPWLFYVQRQSKKQELEDIMDKLQSVDDHC